MLWLAGLHALELTTSTPDALCPPLEEARAAVLARVGEVQGEFRAEFGLIRHDDGGRALGLVLREGDEPVLRRELPLDGDGCDDAAQAIALVLERYFDSLDAPELAEPAPKLESVPVAGAAPSSQDAPVPLAAAPTAGPRRTSARGQPWRARVGLLYDHELGLAPTVGVLLYPHALELSHRLRIGAALDLGGFLPRRAQTVREQDLTLTTLQASFSIPLTLEWAGWESSIGPWAHWRFQRAEAPAGLDGAARYRAVPGVGGFAQLALNVGRGWLLGARAALGAQLPRAAARFVLLRDNGERNAVLVPDAWFAQGELGALLSF